MLRILIYWFGKIVVGLYAKIMYRMDIVHHDTLPAGPKIIVANHPSTIDPFLMLTLGPDRVSILIEDTLFKVPLFGLYLKEADHVRVNPSNGREAFDKARRLLEAGRSVVIFPEGTISPLSGGMCRPRTGAVRLALMTGAPIVPIGIHLPRERLRLLTTIVDHRPEIGTWYFNGPYAMTIGQAIHFEGSVEDREQVVSHSERVMARIEQLSELSARRMKARWASTGG